MGGVTPNGIHYPDGASKAKNLGQELERMANDIDAVFTDTSESGPWRGIVRDIAEDVVPDVAGDLSLVESLPTEPLPVSSRSELEISWANRSLIAPYYAANAAYPTAVSYPGYYRTGDRYRKSVPLLNNVGKLPASTIPDDLLREGDLPEDIARLSDIPDVSGIPTLEELSALLADLPSMERRIHPQLPIFAGRVSAAVANRAPVAVGLAGSSTTARNRYVERLARIMQGAYPLGVLSDVQVSTDAIFTEVTDAGMHFYNAGEGGTASADYLNDSECNRMGALNLALMIHMIGANDYWLSVNPETYRSRMTSRLAYLDGVLPHCQHLLVHTYPRWGHGGAGNYEYPWDEYGAVLRDIADERDNTVFIDNSRVFAALGVSATDHSDPFDLVDDTDNIHPTVAGDELIATQLSAQIVI